MSNQRETRPRFTGVPTRLPGKGKVRLEPVAGDIQIRPRRPRLLGLGRGRAKATRRQRSHLYQVKEEVPVSGIYDVVDEDGNYLGFQVTCHEGSEFPSTHSSKALDGKGKPHWRYRLAYEAKHLVPPPPADEPPQQTHVRVPPPGEEKIHQPGDLVPISGVYNVVDLSGEYLLHQRACVHSKVKDPEKKNRFPETEGPEPGSYGYRLRYRAAHLSEN